MGPGTCVVARPGIPVYIISILPISPVGQVGAALLFLSVSDVV